MYTILILGLSVSVALGDVSLGYHYDRPTTSYGLPLYQVGGGNSAFSSASTFPSNSNAFSVVTTYPVNGGNVFSTSNQNYEFSGSLSGVPSGPSVSTVGLTSGSNYNLHGSSGNSGSITHNNKGSSGHYNSGAASSSGLNYNSFNTGASGTGLNSNYNSGQNSNYNSGSISSTSGLNSNYNTGNAVLSGSNSNYNSGSVASGLNSNYNAGSVSSTSGQNSNYNTGSVSSGSNSNYNTASSVASGSVNHNAGSANFNTVGGGNYNNAGNSNFNSAGGYLSSSNYIGGSGSNTGSNYNYLQGGQSSGVSYIPNYQTIPSVTVDTSALDKIGNYYQSASAANQFISNHQSSHVQKQEYLNVVQSNQPAQVFKHYYVHAAPEEPEENKPRAPIVLPPPQKHYKIIFIKAPAQPQPQPQIITVPQQTEEKTIVYVLVKKPEDAKNVVIPKFDQKAPTKPEVFFIKYNNKHDSQSLINNIVNDYNKGGISATFSGAGSLTSKLGEEDTANNEGSSSSSAAAEVSEGDLASTIQSVFGSPNPAQSDSSVSVGSVSSTGAITSEESSSSADNSGSSDASVSSNDSSSDNNSPLELSLNFAPQTSSSDSIINDVEANSGSSSDSNVNNGNSATESSSSFSLNSAGNIGISSDSSDTSKPSGNRAGDNSGDNNGVFAIFNNIPSTIQSYIPTASTIQNAIPANFQNVISSGIQNAPTSFQNVISSGIQNAPTSFQNLIPSSIQNAPTSFQNGITSGIQSALPSNFQSTITENIKNPTTAFGNLAFNPVSIGSTAINNFLPGSQTSNSADVQSDSLISGSNKFGSDYSSGSESSSGSGVESSGFGGKYQFNTISTSQGVPHVTYGVPKFRS